MKKLYTFFDRISGIYSAPFIGERQEAVVRCVKLAIAQGGQQPWQVFPKDHDLFVIAEFSDTDGRIYGYENPEFVCHISDVLEVE